MYILRFFIILVYLILYLLDNLVVDACPSHCSCTTTNVQCTHHELKVVPTNIPEDIINLDLSHNLITHLPANSFNKLSHLKSINLNDNEMKSIDPAAFKGLKRIREIRLVNNDLSKINVDTFKSFEKLLHIYFSLNEFETIPKFNSPSITRLNLDSNHIRDGYIDDSFLSCTALQTIVLTKNKLQVIKAGDFVNLKNTAIHSLMLKFNELISIDARAFAPLRNTLMTLELEGNTQLGSNALEVALQGFSGSEHMHYLDLKNVGLSNISANFFQPFVSSKLHHIEMSSNPQLRWLHEDAFSGLNRVQILNANSCALVQANTRFSAMKRLRNLSLSHNRLTKAPYRLPGSLEVLELQFNQIRRIGASDFKSLTQLRLLHLADNAIVEVAGSALADLPSLQLLDLSGNRLRHVEPALLRSQGLSSLQQLLLDRQQPCLLSLPQPALPSLRILSLTHNCLVQLPDFLCAHLPALRFFSLAYNTLTALSPSTLLLHCTGLVVLDLSHNSLVTPPDLTGPATSLTTLHLAYNSLSSVTNLPPMPALTAALLSNNRWNCSSACAPPLLWLLRYRAVITDADNLLCSPSTEPLLSNLQHCNIKPLSLTSNGTVIQSSLASPNSLVEWIIVTIFSLLFVSAIGIVIRKRKQIIVRVRGWIATTRHYQPINNSSTNREPIPQSEGSIAYQNGLIDISDESSSCANPFSLDSHPSILPTPLALIIDRLEPTTPSFVPPSHRDSRMESFNRVLDDLGKNCLVDTDFDFVILGNKRNFPMDDEAKCHLQFHWIADLDCNANVDNALTAQRLVVDHTGLHYRFIDSNEDEFGMRLRCLLERRQKRHPQETKKKTYIFLGQKPNSDIEEKIKDEVSQGLWPNIEQNRVVGGFFDKLCYRLCNQPD